MARAPKTPPSANALIPWDEQLARDAEIAAAAEANTGGGSFFSVKSGVLSFNDTAIPNNQMAVVVLDTVFENVFYEGKYDPANPTPPTCFAFSHDESQLAPYITVEERGQAQHETCLGCPMNQWATAETGRGKACRNTRRLALIPAGEFDNKSGNFQAHGESAHYEKAQIGFLKLPVTSVAGYATFVKQVSGALKRPPHGIFTRVRVVPDARSQFKVLFEPLDRVPDHLMQAVMTRRQEAAAVIEQPYNLDVQAPPAAAPAKGKGKPSPVNARPAVKKKY